MILAKDDLREWLAATRNLILVTVAGPGEEAGPLASLE